jgi:hypothetical protein
LEKTKTANMKTLPQTYQTINSKNSKLFGALFMMLFIQGCIKEEYDKVEHKTNYYYLTAAQLNQTPYFTNPTFDTISFTSDKGDTLTFVKTKTDTTWYCENGWGNPNTGYDKDCYQTIHNTYVTVKGNGSFDVNYNYYTSQYGLFRIEIFFGNVHFVICECVINDKTYKNYVSDFKIGNNTFSDSFFEFHNLVDDSIAKGYFNKNYGLFYLNDKLNDTEYFILK